MRPPTPSPLARREALRQQLALALTQRDRSAVLRLSTQWVHRHGVISLEPLMLDLVPAELTSAPGEASTSELLAWWRQVLHEPVAQAEPRQAPGEVSPAREPAAPAVLTLSAPSPSGPFQSDATPNGARSSGTPPTGELTTGARVLPFPQASARRRPAPAPAHPGLASLRAWLSAPGVVSAEDPGAAAITPEDLDRAA
ncbi:hypothetical protein [Vulcanococcus limneticus]|uniref:hypothetical protein n=1 Tax=Vulcanococcus limneticus TaxID=2170428 RepID=UPI00398BCB0C